MSDQKISRCDHPIGSLAFRRRWLPSISIIALFAMIPLVVAVLDQPFLLRVCTRIVVFSIAAVGLNFILGFGGLISFMHAAFFGVGGYAIGILARHSSLPLFDWPFSVYGTTDLGYSIPLALVASAVAAAAFGLIALRTTGAYFIMITLAFNQMLFFLFVALERYGGDEGLQISTRLHFGGIPIGNRTLSYFACLGALAAALILTSFLVESRFGMVLRAASQNEQRVIAVGIPVLRYRLVAFIVSGTIAGLAGALTAITQQFISPADMSWVRSADFVVIVVLGGINSVWGPVLGAAMFFILELVLPAWTVHWQLPFGLLIIALVIFLRGGLTDIVNLVWSRSRGHG